jgi:periplasmic copper chaperone A
MMTRAGFRVVVVLVAAGMILASLLGGCSKSGPQGAGVSLGDLSIENAYSRPAPAGGIGGAFLTVVNHGGTSDRLVAARTSVADSVELHETINDNGVMKMRPVTGGYEVPANGKLELKPGGNHMMFVGLKSALTQGNEVEITLTFEKAGEVTVKAPVHQ